MSYQSIYSQVWDVVIFGAGYPGFAAAWTCRRAGKRVLLVDRSGALLWESGWSFLTAAGESVEPLWLEWLRELTQRGAYRHGRIDGAIAEIVASDFVPASGVFTLFYAAPVGLEYGGNGELEAVIMGGKGGLRRLYGRQWIDATEGGELWALSGCRTGVPVPARQTLHLYFRGAAESQVAEAEWTSPLLPEARLRWSAGVWPNERCLTVELPGNYDNPRRAWVPALRSLRETYGCGEAVLTHGSVAPITCYDRERAAFELAPNAAAASRCTSATLAARFEAGLHAGREVIKRPAADVRWNETVVGLPKELAREYTEVGVAGLGTGGALAALAAARTGSRVFAFDLLPFAGGIGSGGGIHSYYFGVQGGMQEELDRRVREIMPLFGAPGQIAGFHPDAKKIVLEEMLSEAGVAIRFGSILTSVRTEGSRAEEVLVATPAGPVLLSAKGWIDATGDGDLAAFAGARFRLGRSGDGLLHAYSQSSGRAELKEGRVAMQIVNFDAGYCDPTDEEDLTRARLAGVRQYLRNNYDAWNRPTYIAPAIGLRQSRHIHTEYTLTLDDLIERRKFPDAIGYTGGHYDNHAKDYEFETEDAAFWVWVCRQWCGRLACEIPLRILFPVGLSNVVLACRAAGVSEEAHHAFRMQRDMQRIGEAAGIVCALAVREDGVCARIPFPELHERLAKSGAICLEENVDETFGCAAPAGYFRYDEQKIDAWLQEMQAGPATEALWHLYRAGASAGQKVFELLGSPDKTVSWRAAAILAMWADARAEARLGEAIRSREEGEKAREITLPRQEWCYVPRWYAAVTVLRRCITMASLPVLEDLAADQSLVHNIRNATALACAALAGRSKPGEVEKRRMLSLLDRLLATSAPVAVRDPLGSPLAPAPDNGSRPRVREDYGWQLAYAVARARRALGEDVQGSVERLLSDPRRIVRRAIGSFFER